jgi:hypothetical protein
MVTDAIVLGLGDDVFIVGNSFAEAEAPSTDHKFEFSVRGYNSDGNGILSKNMSTTYINSLNPQSITVDKNNSIYIVGGFNRRVVIDGTTYDPHNNNGGDPYVMKLNHSGVVQYFNHYSVTAFSIYNKQIVKTDSMGNVIIVSMFSGTATFDALNILETIDGIDDIYLLKLDPLGNVIYANKYGNTYDNEVPELLLDSQDNMWLAGTYKGAMSFDAHELSAQNELDLYLVKITPNGQAVSAYTPFTGQGDEIINSFDMDGAGAFYMLGTFTGTFNYLGQTYVEVDAENDDFFYLRYSP